MAPFLVALTISVGLKGNKTANLLNNDNDLGLLILRNQHSSNEETQKNGRNGKGREGGIPKLYPKQHKMETQ